MEQPAKIQVVRVGRSWTWQSVNKDNEILTTHQVFYWSSDRAVECAKRWLLWVNIDIPIEIIS